jgi:hypothetical protein
LTQAIFLAFSLAIFNAGSSNPARMAMIAITTRSSISVNNEELPEFAMGCGFEFVFMIIFLSLYGFLDAIHPERSGKKLLEVRHGSGENG